MILIGQYDSPFVRRAAIALMLYDLSFEHRPLSVFGDGEAVRALNPLMRVPALVLDDGDVLTDSHLILDYLDSLVADPLFPRTEPDRRRALRVAGLACGVADKAVSLFYERRLHDVVSPGFEARLRMQIASGLTALEAERRTGSGVFWFGDRIGHADIAMACVWRFGTESHPDLFDPHRHPALSAHAGRLDALPAFRQTTRPFAPPG